VGQKADRLDRRRPLAKISVCYVVVVLIALRPTFMQEV
jgi:hypothetical protein